MPSSPSSQQPWKGRRLHLIGIGGAGMSGYALVAQALGAEVTGSDRADSSYTERLRAAGIEPRIGHDAANLPAGAEVAFSTAIGDENPELAAARAAGATVLHRSELLGEIAALKRAIAIAGTHGKTTTTAMVAHCLAATGRDPAFLVGGEVSVAGGEPTNARWSQGEWIVVEADESDGSFLRLAPEVAAVTNVELDHHATYASVAEVDSVFADFLARVAPGGAIVRWDQPELAHLCPPERRVLRYDAEPQAGAPPPAAGAPPPAAGAPPAPGAAPPDLLAAGVELAAAGSRFTLVRDGEEAAAVELAVPGRHNVLNALACLACCELAGVGLAEAGAALAGFGGVGRRFERKGSWDGVTVYDDYAHHPTEVRATLETARRLGAGRVVAAFQPHLYSRTLALHREFGRALALADEVVVLDVYEARERREGRFAGVSGKLVADAVADAAGGRRVAWLPTQDEALAYLAAELRDGDVLLTIGAGDVNRLGERLLAGEGRPA